MQKTTPRCRATPSFATPYFNFEHVIGTPTSITSPKIEHISLYWRDTGITNRHTRSQNLSLYTDCELHARECCVRIFAWRALTHTARYQFDIGSNDHLSRPPSSKTFVRRIIDKRCVLCAHSGGALSGLPNTGGDT